MSDEYVPVTGKLRARTGKAVLLDVGTDVSRGSWVPRSCIHGADERTLDRLALGQELTLRIFEWKAIAEGLI